MRQVSNSDFYKILRLLQALSKTECTTLREKENRRQAYVLHRKLSRKEERDHAVSNTNTL